MLTQAEWLCAVQREPTVKGQVTLLLEIFQIICVARGHNILLLVNSWACHTSSAYIKHQRQLLGVARRVCLLCTRARSCCGMGSHTHTHNSRTGLSANLALPIRVSYTCSCSVSPEETDRSLACGQFKRRRQKWPLPLLSPWGPCPVEWRSAPQPLIYFTCLNW